MTDLMLRSVKGSPLSAADHDNNMLRLYGFPSLAAMVADKDRGYAFYAAGATVTTLAEGFRYRVAASGATDHHLTTAAGLKLHVLPADDGSYNLGAFNPAGDDATDDHAVFDLAAKVAAEKTLCIPPKTYFLSKAWEFKQRIKVIGYDARLRFPPGVDGMVNHANISWGRTGIVSRNLAGAALPTHQASLVQYKGQVYHPDQSVKRTTYSSAQLAAEEPGTGSRWVRLRAVDSRDGSLPTWTGAGTYLTMNYNPGDGTNQIYRTGSYIRCVVGGDFYYRVAEPDAQDHDVVTMFDIKLYIVAPEDYPSVTSAAGATFEGFTLDGTSVDADPADGISLRSGAFFRNVTVENFSRHGFRAQAGVTGEIPYSTQNWGNVNTFSIENLVSRNNGDTGFYIQGSDANGGVILGGEFTGNGRVGIWDNSFLGNTYLGCRTEGNGIGTSAGNAGGRSSVVSYGGDLYRAVWVAGNVSHMADSQLALLASTRPGTNPAVWENIGKGAPSDEYPLWVSGKDAGFYFLGLGIMATNGNARTLLMGCTTGEYEAGNIFAGNFITVIGGHMPRIIQGGQVLAENGGGLTLPILKIEPGGSAGRRILIGNTNASDLVSFHPPGSSNGWAFRWFDSGLYFSWPGPSTQTAFIISSEDTTLTFGTSAPIPHVFSMPNGYALGTGANARRQNIGTAAPGTGGHARGEIVFNQNPSAGGHMGWICVTGGTPGVWKTFGSIAS